MCMWSPNGMEDDRDTGAFHRPHHSPLEAESHILSLFRNIGSPNLKSNVSGTISYQCLIGQIDHRGDKHPNVVRDRREL